jgi:hypothetical protein
MYIISTRSVARARLEGEAATARAAMLRDASQRRAAMLLSMRGSGEMLLVRPPLSSAAARSSC